ncbi:MAG: pyridoxal phosphate-dependent aminotransferase [Myxococcales bacterium]
MLSKRGDFDLALNALARQVAATPPVWDLTVSNPTNVGLSLDQDAVRRVIGTVDPSKYEPDPRGLSSARCALGRQLDWNPDHLVLTATTSEAYSFLIKLFCDPGDHVLIPEPSYPLLSMLTRLEGASVAPYRFRYDGDWHIDRASFLEHLDSQPKLIFVVSPNNPTGAYLSEDDLEFVSSHGLPVVVDEVFAAYDLRAKEASPLRHSRALSGLSFALGGLSKAAALPQLKLSWIAVSGDEERVERAQAQLDVITDTYLSANELTQRALPGLLSKLSQARRQIVFERLEHNRQSALLLRDDVPEMTVLPVQGGWYQVLRLPGVMSEEDWVIRFLQHGVLVQPGWFYDFPDEAWVVVSLLTPPEAFAEGMACLGRVVAASIQNNPPDGSHAG